MINVEKFIAGLHDWLEKQFKPVVERLTALEQRAPVDGQDGKDVDMAAVRADVVSEVEKAVAALPKAKDGVSVSPEEVERIVAADVERRVDARVKQALANLQLPQDGEPGRDAAQIEVLPAIDEEKAYPRGTYATHCGGLWRAFEATFGMRGWECLVDGIADLRVEALSERMFEVVAVRSSGATTRQAMRLPTMLYRGMFREGDAYEAGDTVTFGGSLWHCNEDTRDKPGEAGKAWTLAAKRGRDGKDGTNGKDFTRGVALS